jgi:hypothetical protein
MAETRFEFQRLRQSDTGDINLGESNCGANANFELDLRNSMITHTSVPMKGVRTMAGSDNGNAYDEKELRRARFDDAAVAAVHNAEAEAKQRNQYGIDAQFLLLGLLHD